MPLHSNLVIFKWIVRTIKYICTILYIPIWLYSNFVAVLLPSAITSFTFQSGYIQINCSVTDKVKAFVPLHSNLVIFKFTTDVCFPDVCLSFTFQSGYIQIVTRIRDTQGKRQLYIPIWLYSNKFKDIKNPPFFKLYIPIWLYSNGTTKNVTDNANITLHSNLVIFKLTQWRIFQTEEKLYIPIWLYSNCSSLSIKTNPQSFTFQSGYIQIRGRNTIKT